MDHVRHDPIDSPFEQAILSESKRRCRRRSRIEIMFGRLKDWRSVAIRYDPCPTVFFFAIAPAATVIFWL